MKTELLKIIRMDKTTVTVLLGGLFIFITGFIRPPREAVNTGLNVAEFQIQKINTKGEYDIVIAGDSRAQIGVSPVAMQTILNEYSIYNFGFDHNAYNHEYLEAVNNCLNPNSKKQTIVLCISPQSLTEEAASWNGFLSLQRRTRSEEFESLYLANFLGHFKTFDPYDLIGYVRGIPQMKYYQHYNADGFIASRKEPPDTMYQINRYSDRFENNKVSEELVTQLLEFVAGWHREGIEVIGIRLPTSEPMLILESRESGFNQEQFVISFTQAGGSWLELTGGAYYSYDGSHLHEESAHNYSVDLAKELNEIAD